MNKEQMAYAVAKAQLEALEEAANERETAYIVENTIKNPDGSIPKHLWCMEDELIAYGLSLAPDRVRKVLEKSAQTDWKTREKILELTFRLDCREGRL